VWAPVPVLARPGALARAGVPAAVRQEQPLAVAEPEQEPARFDYI